MPAKRAKKDGETKNGEKPTKKGEKDEATKKKGKGTKRGRSATTVVPTPTPSPGKNTTKNTEPKSKTSVALCTQLKGNYIRITGTATMLLTQIPHQAEWTWANNAAQLDPITAGIKECQEALGDFGNQVIMGDVKTINKSFDEKTMEALPKKQTDH